MTMVTERIWCCVCSGSGKVSRLFLWRKNCHICDGTGKRPIMMDARFPENIKRQIRDDAMFGVNTYAALSGQRNNAPTSALSQLGIF